MRKNIIALMGTCMILTGMCTGCSEDTQEVEEHAQEVASVISDGNIDEVNQIIFGYQELELDEEVAGIINDNEENKGILSEIFKRNSIKVEDVGGDEIVYEIESPNLSEAFEQLMENETALSEEKMLENFKQYIKEAEMQTQTVSVPYTVVGEEITVNYRTEEFINAITGGMLESYQKVYQEMMDEYTE